MYVCISLWLWLIVCVCTITWMSQFHTLLLISISWNFSLSVLYVIISLIFAIGISILTLFILTSSVTLSCFSTFNMLLNRVAGQVLNEEHNVGRILCIENQFSHTIDRLINYIHEIIERVINFDWCFYCCCCCCFCFCCLMNLRRTFLRLLKTECYAYTWVFYYKSNLAVARHSILLLFS